MLLPPCFGEGHTYSSYAPLLNGAHTVIFEGVPTHPHPGRLWEVWTAAIAVLWCAVPALAPAPGRFVRSIRCPRSTPHPQPFVPSWYTAMSRWPSTTSLPSECSGLWESPSTRVPGCGTMRWWGRSVAPLLIPGAVHCLRVCEAELTEPLLRWQTETGGIMIAPLPGATPTKPGSATMPFFGVNAKVSVACLSSERAVSS